MEKQLDKAFQLGVEGGTLRAGRWQEFKCEGDRIKLLCRRQRREDGRGERQGWGEEGGKREAPQQWGAGLVGR